MFASHVRIRSLSALLIGASLSVAACATNGPSVDEELLGGTFEEPYPYPTPCGEEGGPDCEIGWCLDAAGICPPDLVATCDPLFLTISCELPTIEPPVVTEDPVVAGTLDAPLVPRFQESGPETSIAPDLDVNPAAPPDMTGWYDELGTKGKVNIKTSDGSLDAEYTVVKKDKSTLELKVTGGGWKADFDPNNPLVIKLYDDAGTMKYKSTGTLRVIVKGNVSLKNGPDAVDVSKNNGVIEIKKGGDTIKISNNGAKSMKLEGNVGGKDVTIVFKQ
jgi:hypothetical protein